MFSSIALSSLRHNRRSYLAPTDPPVSVEDLITGYRQLIGQAHARNIRILGATLTLFEDSFKVVNPPLDYFYIPKKRRLVRRLTSGFVKARNLTA